MLANMQNMKQKLETNTSTNNNITDTTATKKKLQDKLKSMKDRRSGR